MRLHLPSAPTDSSARRFRQVVRMADPRGSHGVGAVRRAEALFRMRQLRRSVRREAV